MRPARSYLTAALYCAVMGLCVGIAAAQLWGLVQRVASRQAHRQEYQRQHPLLAFGQADMVYFSEPTCPACQMASPAVASLQRRYPRYTLAHVDTSTASGVALQEEYNHAYRVPRGLQDRIPALFAGRRYFVGVDAIRKELPAYLGRTALVRPSRHLRPKEGGQAILTRRFHSLGVATVLVAGLVDSINPCAIASLIFFLSYLTLGGRRSRDLLWVGGLFTLGVFLTYFLIGLGLLRAVHSLQAVPVLARLLYPVAAVVMVTLAVVSFLDFRRAGRGETGRIALQLPRSVKLRIHQIIRTRMGLRNLGLAAFGTAVLVSGLEFTCTSQVYLPTLMYMAQSGDQRSRATLLLFLYNLMFVLPLILLFTAAALGVSSRTLARVAARHTATAKLAMTVLFVGFAVYLCTVSARMLWYG